MMRKTEENVCQRKKLRNTVPLLCAPRKTEEKCDSKTKFEKHSACVVCREKMLMECRQVSTGEHEGER
jgi:hypothetical protein